MPKLSKRLRKEVLYISEKPDTVSKKKRWQTWHRLVQVLIIKSTYRTAYLTPCMASKCWSRTRPQATTQLVQKKRKFKNQIGLDNRINLNIKKSGHFFEKQEPRRIRERTYNWMWKKLIEEHCKYLNAEVVQEIMARKCV